MLYFLDSDIEEVRRMFNFLWKEGKCGPESNSLENSSVQIQMALAI